MKKRPMIVTILSIFYLLAPLWILLELQFLFYLNIIHKPDWFYYVSYHVAFMVTLTMLAGYGMYKVRPWGYYLVILHSVIVIASNSVFIFKGITVTALYVTLVFNAVMLVILLMFLKKEIYAPYFNPKLRWWEQAKRFLPDNLLVKLYIGKRSMGDFKVFDLSQTGLFLMMEDKLDKIDTEKEYFLLLKLYNDTKVKAKAMWINSSEESKIPKGVGFKFLDINSDLKKEIKKYVKEKSLVQRER